MQEEKTEGGYGARQRRRIKRAENKSDRPPPTPTIPPPPTPGTPTPSPPNDTNSNQDDDEIPSMELINMPTAEQAVVVYDPLSRMLAEYEKMDRELELQAEIRDWTETWIWPRSGIWTKSRIWLRSGIWIESWIWPRSAIWTESWNLDRGKWRQVQSSVRGGQVEPGRARRNLPSRNLFHTGQKIPEFSELGTK